MDKRNLAFGRMNFILLAVGMAVVIVGFILMSGSGSGENTFDADIFSARRIKVAPVVCLVGFVSMIFAVMYKSQDDADANTSLTVSSTDEMAELTAADNEPVKKESI